MGVWTENSSLTVRAPDAKQTRRHNNDDVVTDPFYITELRTDPTQRPVRAPRRKWGSRASVIGSTRCRGEGLCRHQKFVAPSTGCNSGAALTNSAHLLYESFFARNPSGARRYALTGRGSPTSRRAGNGSLRKPA
jgi:hypothetical protein